MVALAEVPDMAKKRSESRRYTAVVRLDEEMVEKARRVAALKNMSVAQFISETMRPIVDRELLKEARKITKEAEQEE